MTFPQQRHRRQALKLSAPAAGGGGPGPSFDPATLFSGGKMGVLLDFTDQSTVWDDLARTSQITNGGTVGGVTDLSGNNQHFGNSTEANQPVWTSPGLITIDSTDELWDQSETFMGVANDRWICGAGYSTGISANGQLLPTYSSGWWFAIWQSGSSLTISNESRNTLNGGWTEDTTLSLTNRGNLYTELQGKKVFLLDTTLHLNWNQWLGIGFQVAGFVEPPIRKWIAVRYQGALSESDRNDLINWLNT